MYQQLIFIAILISHLFTSTSSKIPWRCVVFSDNGTVGGLGFYSKPFRESITNTDLWDMITSSHTALHSFNVQTDGNGILSILHGPDCDDLIGFRSTDVLDGRIFFIEDTGNDILNINIGIEFFCSKDDKGIPFMVSNGKCFRIIEDHKECYFVDCKWNIIG